MQSNVGNQQLNQVNLIVTLKEYKKLLRRWGANILCNLEIIHSENVHNQLL